MLEVGQGAVEVVDQERAVGATRLPPRAEHEVIDDQLAAPGKEVRQGLLPARSVEDVVLVHLDHREPAAFPAQRVALAGELLLLGEQRLPGGNPVASRYDV